MEERQTRPEERMNNYNLGEKGGEVLKQSKGMWWTYPVAVAVVFWVIQIRQRARVPAEEGPIRRESIPDASEGQMQRM